MTDDSLDETTRRAILKGAAATLGVGVAGTAVGHPGSGDHGKDGHEHHSGDVLNTTQLGYHSLGGVGSEDVSGNPESPHYGGKSEIRVRGDIAAVGLLSSMSPTIDRGVALLDVSAYTQADDPTQADVSEMSVISYVPNENGASSVMDVKFSEDGDYLFVCKQPIAVLFQALAGKPPEARTEDDREVSSPQSGALQAVDISDPANPEIVGSYDKWSLGPHNCYHHQIGGEDYVFAVKGTLGNPAAIYVVRFDRSTGEMELVNYWSDNPGEESSTELRQGEPGRQTDNKYAHDIAVVDDPKTGRPLAYLANWANGAVVLDVSDPGDLNKVGEFEMERAHTIEPRTLTVGDQRKRTFVVGQENPGPDGSTGGDGEGHTGYYYLVDADGVEEYFDQDGHAELGIASADGNETGTGKAITDNEQVDSPDAGEDELAKWVWRLDADYDNYTYSAHNVDIVETEIGGTARYFVTAGHYHAGVRLLEIEYPGSPDVDEADNTEFDGEYRDFDGDGEKEYEPISEGGHGSGRDNWDMTEVGYFRSFEEGVPHDAKFASLSGATPYFWGAVESNGVVFGSCINTGVYAIGLEEIAGTGQRLPIGDDQPIDVSVSREDGGDVATGGGTKRVTLSVDAEDGVFVRDRVPSDWKVLTEFGDGDDYLGDVERVEEAGDGKLVHLSGPVEDGPVEYFVKAPHETGVYTFGEVEYAPAENGEPTDEDRWLAVSGDTDTMVVGGASTELPF